MDILLTQYPERARLRQYRSFRSTKGPSLLPLHHHTSVNIPLSILRGVRQRSANNDAPNLTTLPPELHLELLGYLHPIESTLLGLTCKTMYAAHLARHGMAWQNKVLLSNPHVRMNLFSHLRSWMGPNYSMFVLWGYYPTFVHSDDIKVEGTFGTIY